MTRTSPGPNPRQAPPWALAPRRGLVLALFFSSGVTALVYEVLWQRQFALVLGSAAPATAAVLGAYLGGLALGSYLLGVRAESLRQPLRTYALLEGLAGLGALLVQPLLRVCELAHPWLQAHFPGHSAGSFLVRTMVVFLAIGFPTACLGGTLPVLAQWAERRGRSLGTNTGLLYVANTGGAVLGILAVPFMLLPAFGLQGTLWLAAALNAVIAVGAWSLDRSGTSSPIAAEEEKKRPLQRLSMRDGHAPLLTLAFVSGAALFVLQVQWNRAFAQVHENSMYSFAVIAAVFILALAVGGQVARVLLRATVLPEQVLGWGWLLGGGAVAASVWGFLRLTNGLAYLPGASGWASYAGHLLGCAGAVVFGPVLLLGLGWPAILELAGRRSAAAAGRIVGSLAAWNLAGAVSGALLAGFVLPRWLALWDVVLVTAAGLAAAGAWQLGGGGRRALLAWIGVLGAVGWGIAQLDLPRVKVSSRAERLVATKEGVHGIVAVVERGNSRRLKLNNHYVLGGTASTGDERMQAHLPLLLHPSPKQVAFLGLGTAITASGSLFHPTERVTAVELVPEVVAAARTHFREANAGFLEAPNSRVLVGDARSFLRASGAEFDVIIGDLVVPWRQGEGALLTWEQFAAARRALAAGGIFCQWLPLFQLSRAELDMIARTFLTVFPEAWVWRGDFSPDQPAVALIGAAGALELDPARLRRRLGEMRVDPANPQLTESSALWMYLIGTLRLSDVGGTGRINQEEEPWIELTAPWQHAGQAAAELCIGRRLQSWSREIRRRSDSAVTSLGPEVVAAAQAGDLLFEYTLLLSERQEEAARQAQNQLRSLLAPGLYAFLFPPAPVPAAGR